MKKADPHSAFLVFRTGPHCCALPLGKVVETLRPLPVQSLSDAPACVLGIAILRGSPVPVLDCGQLLGLGPGRDFGRFVSLNVGERCVALAVDRVLGVRALPLRILVETPPLLRAADRDVFEALGILDGELLYILKSAYLVPSELLERLEPGAP